MLSHRKQLYISLDMGTPGLCVETDGFLLLIYFSWTLSRCAAQWQEYQKAREEVIELMNDGEKKLSEFSLLKTSSGQEAEEKLSEHKVSFVVVIFMSFTVNCNESL